MQNHLSIQRVRLSFRAFRVLAWVLVLSLWAGERSAQAMSSARPVPDLPLTEEQKSNDMRWLFTIFESNYAPLRYKESRRSFEFAKIKRQYLRKALQTQTNEEFYAVMQEFVARFGDAHTSLTLTPAVNMPGHSHIAFTGFLVKRIGNQVMVTELLPIVDPAVLPVKVGDVITHVNGVPVLEYIDKEMTQHRDLGNALANRTALANAVFLRDSLKFPMPKEDSMNLKIARYDQGKFVASDATVHWVKRDYADFKAKMTALTKKNGEVVVNPETNTPFQVVEITDQKTGKRFELGIRNQSGRLRSAEEVIDALKKPQTARSRLGDLSMEHLNFTTDIVEADVADMYASNASNWRKTKTLPKYHEWVESSGFFPSYVFSTDIKNRKGERTGLQKKIGYIKIIDFSPKPYMKEKPVLKDAGNGLSTIENMGAMVKPTGETVYAEIQQTLKFFEAKGVTDIIIDTVDNPGGSLALVLSIAQAFSNKKINPLQMEFRFNENWMKDFKELALSSTEPQRTFFEKIYRELLEQRPSGEWLSKGYDMDVIMPYELKPNTDIKNPPRIVVLQNEMNASCGDIFPAIMKANALATTAGKNTMGAGGNVTSYSDSPHAHAILRQTESLIRTPDGTYLENNGVPADVDVDLTVVARQPEVAAMEVGVKILTRERGMTEYRSPGICENLLK